MSVNTDRMVRAWFALLGLGNFAVMVWAMNRSGLTFTTLINAVVAWVMFVSACLDERQREIYGGNLGLYMRGFRWLWTRQATSKAGKCPECGGWLDTGWECTDCGADPLVYYKPGWGPLWPRPFIIPYLTTYLAATLCGFGVVSISRAAWERAQWFMSPAGFPQYIEGHKWRPLHRWSSRAVRLIDWVFERFGQENHCKNAGPILWGSRSAWERST